MFENFLKAKNQQEVPTTVSLVTVSLQRKPENGGVKLSDISDLDLTVKNAPSQYRRDDEYVVFAKRPDNQLVWIYRDNIPYAESLGYVLVD